MLLVILKAKKCCKVLRKRVAKNKSKTFRVEKVIKRNYMLNGKATVIRLIVGLIKKT